MPRKAIKGYRVSIITTIHNTCGMIQVKEEETNRGVLGGDSPGVIEAYPPSTPLLLAAPKHTQGVLGHYI